MDWLWFFVEKLREAYTWVSGTPVVADGNSIVNANKISGVIAKSLIIKSETVSDPRTQKTDNAVGQTPRGTLTARDCSISNANKVSDSTFDGDMDFSSAVK